MQISVQRVSKTYHNYSNKTARKVLDQLDLSVAEGEKIAIVGPSGTGKTSLLNILGALDKADEGIVAFNNQNISQFSEKEANLFRNQKIGFVFQQHNLLPQLNVLENILLPTIATPTNKQRSLERAEELLKTLGLSELKTQQPSELSGGECQRVAVARALINQPELILADEPTGSLDEGNAQELTQLLIELNQRFKTTLVVVTHSEQVAKQMDTVYFLKKGKLHV